VVDQNIVCCGALKSSRAWRDSWAFSLIKGSSNRPRWFSRMATSLRLGCRRGGRGFDLDQCARRYLLAGCGKAKEATMTTASGSRPAGMLGGLVEWWRNLRAASVRLDELHNCGDDIGAIARDVGLSRSDLCTIAAKRPDAADQLKLRLEALHLDRAAVLRTDPLVVRDLERVCTVCGSKRQCKRDWVRHPDDEVWRAYCPNAHTLEALERGAAAERRD
jgi:hypothetical protein